MTIKTIKVGYSTSIPIAPYGIKDNAWAEIEVETNGEPYSYEELFSQLKATVDDAVRKEYPHLFGSTVSKEYLLYPLTPNEVQIDKQDFSLEKEIGQCEDIVNLKSCEFLIRAEKNEERKRNLWLLYDKKLEQLQLKAEHLQQI